jgi:hypothetical protein
MATIRFEPPDGADIENPSLDFLQPLFTPQATDFWQQGSGDGVLIYSGMGKISKLILLFHSSLGFHAKYLDHDRRPWLSLSDPNQLSKVIVSGNNWRVSRGLFLPIDRVWNVVADFVSTGERSSSITWIEPRNLPREGNW